MSVNLVSKARRQLAGNTRERRLQMDLTQEGLAVRSGVPVRTLRKFEQEGIISLESFLKLYAVLGGMDRLISATAPVVAPFTSIDEVLQRDTEPKRKRGRRK